MPNRKKVERSANYSYYSDLLWCTVPLIGMSWYYYGARPVLLLLAALLTAYLCDCALAPLHGTGYQSHEPSSECFAALIVLLMPASISYPIVISAVIVAVLVKEAFGGIGHNLFNPAMAARGLLLVAFPTLLTGYTRPDAVSSATPLSGIGSPGGPADWLPMLTGTENGSMGETSALLLLVGGIYLVLRGVIRLRIPMTCLGTFAAVMWVFGGERGLFTGNVVAQLLSGGLMLGAFYMVTDFTTKPTTFLGELLFAGGVGALTAVLRIWGPYPEGVCFAILLMNLTVPLLEYLTRPRVYGLRPLLFGIRPLRGR